MEAKQKSDPTRPSKVQRGFGLFVVEVASLLTIATVRKLANVFNYASAHIEECERDKNPGYVFVMSLRERGIINPYDVSILVDALREIDMNGIGLEVMISFEKNCLQMGTFDSPVQVNSPSHRAAFDELFESFRRNLSMSQPTETKSSTEAGKTMEAKQKSDPTKPSKVARGFGLFVVEVASFLTIATVRKLANVFNYGPAHIEECERDKNPGYVFVMSLRERGIINPYDVSILVDALRDIDLNGIGLEVMISFEKNCLQKGTFDSPVQVNSPGHRAAFDELFESFRRNLSMSQPMDTKSSTEAARMTIFVDSIKITYQDLCSRVQPVPFIRDRLLSVSKVFIDSGLERLARVGESIVWQKLKSYHSLFDNQHQHPKRCILFGEPGFGKSTLSLQLVYDWCNRCPESPLKNVDVLIFLRLRQLSGVNSVFKAIKQFVLPPESQLSEIDILEILDGIKSVVILLDGYDEYANKTDEEDFINNIIKGRMFTKFFVMVTTRPSYEPLQTPAEAVFVRLNGFNSKAQDEYLRKTVANNDPNTAEKVKSYIENNPTVRDFCEVPLFFTMFSNLTYKEEMSKKFESVTSFFRYMIGSFHEHMKNKLKGNELKKYEELQKDHGNLGRVSFEALAGKTQEIGWMKEYLQKSIGNDLYSHYVNIGILVEEETVEFNDAPGSPTSALTTRKTQTRFYHKLFCEWYAAHYVSQYATTTFTFTLKWTLSKLDPFELQYLFRFACGINPEASPRIIKYLRSLEGGDKFAILCILEQTGHVDNILEFIRQMCFEGVIISGHDSLLLQRSSFQLLDIAVKYEIPIEYVKLYNCLQSVDLSTAAIRSTSGLALTARILVKTLAVSLYNREMTEDEAIGILEFSSHCSSLNFLWLYGSVPPQSFKVDSTLATLKSRNVQVRWKMFEEDKQYILNLETGRWQEETEGKEPTTAEFENMRSEFLRSLERRTDEFSQNQVKGFREFLRIFAEERKSNQN